MPAADLATIPLRELNAALHRLAPDTADLHWRVLNPRGEHAIAAGLTAPVTVEIHQQLGVAQVERQLAVALPPA